MNPVVLAFGILYAAAGLVFSIWNAADWLAGHTEPVGRMPLRFTRWQWAVLWACVCGIGIALAVWSA